MMWSALSTCQNAYEVHKKALFEQGERERKLEEEKQKWREKNLQKQSEPPKKSDEELLSSFFAEVAPADSSASKAPEPSAPAPVQEEDPLAAFFAEVGGGSRAEPSASAAAVEERDQQTLTQKYVDQELGDPKSQLDRILAENYKFKNLNPYYVLQLDIDATEEDIKYRYCCGYRTRGVGD